MATSKFRALLHRSILRKPEEIRSNAWQCKQLHRFYLMLRAPYTLSKSLNSIPNPEPSTLNPKSPEVREAASP